MILRFTIVSLAISIFLSQGETASAAPNGYRQVDERRARQLGIRKIVGKHLRLYTDLPASNAVDELPVVFDQAVEQWADYFGISQQRIARWTVQGFLIDDRAKFAALDLLPETSTDFENGYCQGQELWLMEQPSDYYRRHLLLHEGTHGFMYAFLSDVGPAWYMEGMAELLGTHRWQDGQLQLGVMPTGREETPMWGRIKFIREAVDQDKALDLNAVLTFDKRRSLTTDEYAWCWSLCKFLDSHPEWHSALRELTEHVSDSDFNQELFRKIPARRLSQEWNAFVACLDYGYDVRRMAIVQRDASPIAARASVSIAAGRGWQATGWLLQEGKEYILSAEGRYQIAHETEPWPCEPDGVTLEYHDGQPLGMVLGALQMAEHDTFSTPIPVGSNATIKPEEDAELYLRVNDSPAQLSDNKGELQVTMETL